MRKLLVVGLLLALLAAALPTLAQDEPGTIVEVASGADDFTTLVAAVEAAGLAETLSGEGPFTVFAPTDEAFAAALEELGITAEDLLGNTELLTSVLTYHVVAGEFTSDVLEAGEVETVNGATVTISLEDGVMVNDATVVTADIAASNGVIHVIDSVLLPPADEAANEETEEAAEEEETEETEEAEEAEEAEETADEDTAEATRQPGPSTAFVRVGHFAANVREVDVYINGQLRGFGEDRAYGSLSEWLIVSVDEFTIRVTPAGRPNTAIVEETSLDLTPNSRTTIAVRGNAQTGDVVADVIAQPEYDDGLGEFTGHITVYHAIPDAPIIDVLNSGELLLGRIGYPGSLTLADGSTNDGVSTIRVPQGTYDLAVVPNGLGEVIFDLSDTEISGGTFYFVVAYGTLAEPEILVRATTP